MINDILDYSQITNGKLRLNFEEVDLWQVIKDVSKLFKFQAKLKGIEFLKENHVIESTQGPKTLSDQNRLKQVLFNLLGNALKFTTKGSIKIVLKKVILKETKGYYSSSKSIVFEKSNFNYECDESAFLISVEDTGIGIKKEDQANLFKMFGRIHNEQTNSLNKSGVGLGLSISQSLVKELNRNRENGEIKVSSEFKKGSKFSFLLYQHKPREEKLLSCLDPISEDEVKIDFKLVQRRLKTNEVREFKVDQKLSILVVDDDQINIIVISTYLKSFENVRFDSVFNGEDAIEKIKAKALENYFYDFILMDCNMPRMNGFETSAIINEMVKKGEIPKNTIIACTANSSPADLEQFSKCGMADFLTKPFSKEDLKKKIFK